MLRLGILPTGSIMVRDHRAIRDLLRRRLRLVQQKTTNLLQLKRQITNNTGATVASARLKTLQVEEIPETITDPFVRRNIHSALEVLQILEAEVKYIHKSVLTATRKNPDDQILRSISGAGEVLAMTILYEIGNRKNEN